MTILLLPFCGSVPIFAQQFTVGAATTKRNLAFRAAVGSHIPSLRVSPEY